MAVERLNNPVRRSDLPSVAPAALRVTHSDSRWAKQAVSELVNGKEVTFQTHGLDKYGRTLGDVLLPDGTNVNHTLVKDGWWWWYRKYALLDTDLEQLEKSA